MRSILKRRDSKALRFRRNREVELVSTRARSSMVEHLAGSQGVVGSNPVGSTRHSYEDTSKTIPVARESTLEPFQTSQAIGSRPALLY